MDDLRQVEIKFRDAYNHIGGNGQTTRVEADLRRASFHGWEDYRDEDMSRKFAIVEFTDGTVSKVLPDEIRFLTSAELTEIAVQNLIGHYKTEDK